MSIKGTIPVEIVYCVPWSYHGEAVWMAAEIFAEAGNKVAIKLTPGISGILKVLVSGDVIFDKHEEGNTYPDLTRVKQIRADIRDRIAK